MDNKLKQECQNEYPEFDVGKLGGWFSKKFLNDICGALVFLEFYIDWGWTAEDVNIHYCETYDETYEPYEPNGVSFSAEEFDH